jgi:hypothetical protein
MAASLTMRTGIPSASAKLKWTQSLPRCFGCRRIRPSRTGAGKPIDATSNYQPLTVSFNLARNCFGVIRGPDANSRSTRSDMSSFTKLPPISTTRILLFMSARPGEERELIGRARTIAPCRPSVRALQLCCWANTLRFQAQRTGTAIAWRISNRVADFLQSVARTGRH